MTSGRLVAVTGGTGFLGRWVVRALAQAGWRIRLLVRRDPVHPLFADIDVEVVLGSLDDPAALRRLVAGADAVIHAAGIVKAARKGAFFTANATGTQAVAEAVTEAAPGARLVLVSSMAAREPALSPYAASKAAAEDILRSHGAGDWMIVRPCAIYGPWDTEMLDLFRAAARGIFPVPARSKARVCLVHVADVAAAIVAVASRGESGATYDVTDATTDGYSWAAIATAAGRAVGRRPRLIPVPPGIVRAMGWCFGAMAYVTGRPVMFTGGKAREALHPDWSSDRRRQPPPEVWQPVIDLDEGFRETVEWYSSHGWIRRPASAAQG